MSIYRKGGHTQHIPTAVLFGVLSALCFTAMSFLSKLVSDQASVAMILFSRFFVSLILILPWVLQDPRQTIKVDEPLKLVYRSLFSVLALGCFFYSLRYIPLTNALLLNNTSPLFVPLVAWAFHQTKTSLKIWGGIVIGFIGILFVLQPTASIFQIASFAGLASGILGAFALVLIRFLTKATSILQIIFYNFLINTLLAGILLPFQWEPLTWKIAFLLLAMGVFGLLYQLCSSIAYARATVRLTSTLMYLCILFGAFVDWFFWNLAPNVYSLVGMTCIILGGIWIIYVGQKESPKASLK